MARVVAPGVPHHVTQRGNRRQETFFRPEDYALYREIMADWCGREGVRIWAYCLMPNHVHLIAVPETEAALRRAIGEAHRRYTLHINAREDWTGHLWQGRFASFPMDEAHLLAATRYVELNPVAAGLVRRPGEWRWSSARAHLEGADDGLATVAPLLELVPDWPGFLSEAVSEDQEAVLEKHGRTGRPLGGAAFIERLETDLSRRFRKGKPGPKGGEEGK